MSGLFCLAQSDLITSADTVRCGVMQHLGSANSTGACHWSAVILLSLHPSGILSSKAQHLSGVPVTSISEYPNVKYHPGTTPAKGVLDTVLPALLQPVNAQLATTGCCAGAWFLAPDPVPERPGASPWWFEFKKAQNVWPPTRRLYTNI